MLILSHGVNHGLIEIDWCIRRINDEHHLMQQDFFEEIITFGVSWWTRVLACKHMNECMFECMHMCTLTCQLVCVRACPCLNMSLHANIQVPIINDLYLYNIINQEIKCSFICT